MFKDLGKLLVLMLVISLVVLICAGCWYIAYELIKETRKDRFKKSRQREDFIKARNKIKNQTLMTDESYDKRPIIEQLNEAYGKGKKYE